jgi:hypothetical protein
MHLLLYPANPKVAKVWLKRAGLSGTAVVGGGIVAAILKYSERVLPAGSVDTTYFYIAMTLAIVTALPLLLQPIVMSVGIAQLGMAASYVYVVYAFRPLFPLPSLRMVLIAVVAILLVAFSLMFSAGASFYFKHGTKLDRVAACAFAAIFYFVSLAPFPSLLR